MQLAAKIVLIINGLAFIGTGIYAFVAPNQLGMGTQISLVGVAGYNEILANYGGMYFCYGLYLILAGMRKSLLLNGLLILTITSFGLFSGRLISILIYGFPPVMQLFFQGWELATAIFGLTYLQQQGELSLLSSIQNND